MLTGNTRMMAKIVYDRRFFGKKSVVMALEVEEVVQKQRVDPDSTFTAEETFWRLATSGDLTADGPGEGGCGGGECGADDLPDDYAVIGGFTGEGKKAE